MLSDTNFMTARQQLVAMDLCGVTYREKWYYLRYLIRNKLKEDRLHFRDCQEIFKILYQEEVFKRVNYFDQFDYIKDSMLELSEQAFIYGEVFYPELWRYIPQPPLLLYYRGNLSVLKKAAVSVIGTRSITPYGNKYSRLISQMLVEEGFSVVSGLAKGVDAAAHQMAIHHPSSTIAILPNGIDIYYPRVNQGLQRRIGDNHLLLSEYLPNDGPKKHYFVMRNRLVAGISPATIVIEAAHKSGSLITANYALQFDRELFVLPGNIDNKESEGCNELIDLGANMIRSVDKLRTDLKELYQVQRQL